MNRRAIKESTKPMAKESFKMTARLAGAVSLVMESGAPDWGAQQHMAALRYLVLACSDKAKLSLADLKNRKPGEKLVLAVDYDALIAEFHQAGKLAECANFKKALADGDYPQFKATAKSETKYA